MWEKGQDCVQADMGRDAGIHAKASPLQATAGAAYHAKSPRFRKAPTAVHTPLLNLRVSPLKMYYFGELRTASFV